jgi:replicative DNA helicase
LPPQNRDAEDAILGAMIMNPQAIEVAVDTGLRETDFYSPANRIIFQTIVELSEKEPIDPVTLVNELTRLGKIDEVGSSSAIVSLVERVPAIGNARSYAEIVRSQSMLRQIVTAGNEIAALGYEAADEPQMVLDQAEQIVYDLAHQRESSDFIDAVSLLTPLYEEISERAEAGGAIPGTPSGFTDLDNLVGGFHPGALIIVGGRASMGKTAFALNVVENVVLKAKLPVALFSLEMDAKELVQRMMCSVARVDAHNVKVGKLDPDDYPRHVEAIGRITKSKNLLNIDQTAALSPMELRSKVRRLHARTPGGLGLVVVDYLQIMEPSKRAENRQVEIAAMSRALKQLARELKVPVIALSQLSRTLEGRVDKRPMLSDLRECVTGDTLVVLADGRRLPIQTLVGTTPTVLAVSTEGRIVEAESDRIWSVGTKEVFEVTFASGRRIRATGKHQFMTGSGWKRLSDLEVGARTALARQLPEPGTTVEWPDDQLVFLGQMIGDGSYLSGQPMRYTSSSDANSDAVRAAAERAFGAHEKRIPEEVFQLSNRQIGVLLQHLWATDGCIWTAPVESTSSNRVFYATNSRGLADDVAALLLRLGIVARIKQTKKSDYRPSFHVTVGGVENQLRFLEFVGAFGPKVPAAEMLRARLDTMTGNTNVDTLPREIMAQVASSARSQGISQRRLASERGTSYGGSSHFSFAPSRSVLSEYAAILQDAELEMHATSDLFWDLVVSIEPAGRAEVFDLTVPGPASWLADGIVSHNSGAIEQDADMVMFVHRPEYYDRDNPELRNKAELIVAKNRSGRTGMVDMVFLDKYTRFENAARRAEQSYAAPAPVAQTVPSGPFPGPPPPSHVGVQAVDDDGIY